MRFGCSRKVIERCQKKRQSLGLHIGLTQCVWLHSDDAPATRSTAMIILTFFGPISMHGSWPHLFTHSQCDVHSASYESILDLSQVGFRHFQFRCSCLVLRRSVRPGMPHRASIYATAPNNDHATGAMTMTITIHVINGTDLNRSRAGNMTRAMMKSVIPAP
jgi:hypothetical protein